MNESRDERLAHIRQLILTQEITSQDDLVHLLTEQNFSCTQSSISRDLGDLGVAKVQGRYVFKEVEVMQRLGIVNGQAAGPNLLVIRTNVGAAQLVAYQIDQLKLSQIIGTVAGDDTIFIATPNEADQQIVAKALGVLK